MLFKKCKIERMLIGTFTRKIHSDELCELSGCPLVTSGLAQLANTRHNIGQPPRETSAVDDDKLLSQIISLLNLITINCLTYFSIFSSKYVQICQNGVDVFLTTLLCLNRTN